MGEAERERERGGGRDIEREGEKNRARDGEGERDQNECRIVWAQCKICIQTFFALQRMGGFLPSL